MNEFNLISMHASKKKFWKIKSNVRLETASDNFYHTQSYFKIIVKLRSLLYIDLAWHGLRNKKFLLYIYIYIT